MANLNYKSAGVNLDVYEESMRRVGQLVQSTTTPGVMPLPGGFAGLYRLFQSGKTYRDPVLVSGTDGVGTKIKVAQLCDQFETIGIDLVAMCVNDCLCTGALPLFFLDYVAMGSDDPILTESLVSGIAEGCRQAGIALIGGETAIMPDLYQIGDFDLAGFCVGVVEKDEVITGQQVGAGDVVIGIPSSGFHSNGYSLIRKAVFEHAGLGVHDLIPGVGLSVGEALLTPTRIYASLMQQIAERAELRSALHAVAHITGGGLQENLARVIPEQIDAQLERSSWQVPPLMQWLQQLAEIEPSEMDRVFNMGIGLVLVCAESAADPLMRFLHELGETPCRLGQTVAGTGQVHLN